MSGIERGTGTLLSDGARLADTSCMSNDTAFTAADVTRVRESLATDRASASAGYMTRAEAESYADEVTRPDPVWKIIASGLFPLAALYRTIKNFRNGDMGSGAAYLVSGLVGLAIWAVVIWPYMDTYGARTAYDAASMADSVTESYAKDGRNLDEAACRRREASEWLCTGDLHMQGVGTIPVTLRVTVHGDGSWESEPI